MKDRILIVDHIDSPHWWEGLKDFFEVAFFSEAKGALLYASESPCKAAIVEIVLPNLSGLDLIKSFVHLTRRPKTFATTSINKESFLSRAYEAGADDYWLKPISIDALRLKLKS